MAAVKKNFTYVIFQPKLFRIGPYRKSDQILPCLNCDTFENEKKKGAINNYGNTVPDKLQHMITLPMTYGMKAKRIRLDFKAFTSDIALSF